MLIGTQRKSILLAVWEFLSSQAPLLQDVQAAL